MANCVICGSPNAQVENEGVGSQVHCVRCGWYVADLEELADLKRERPGHMARLSHRICRMQQKDRPVKLLRELIDKLISDPLPSVREQEESLLLARLERRVKRNTRTATVTMVLLMSLVAWSATARTGKAQAAGSAASDLVARSLTIVDQKGTPRVFLGINTNGPIVQLYDEKGTAGVVLGVTKDGPVAALADEKGRLRATLAVLPDSQVRLYDENGNQRVVLGSGKGGSVMHLNDENGKPRIGLTVIKEGISGLVVADDKGNPRATLGVNANAAPTVELFDEKGKIIWTRP